MPADGVKGKTWGPSTVHGRSRSHLPLGPPPPLAPRPPRAARFSSSAPDLPPATRPGNIPTGDDVTIPGQPRSDSDVTITNSFSDSPPRKPDRFVETTPRRDSDVTVTNSSTESPPQRPRKPAETARKLESTHRPRKSKSQQRTNKDLARKRTGSHDDLLYENTKPRNRFLCPIFSNIPPHYDTVFDMPPSRRKGSHGEVKRSFLKSIRSNSLAGLLAVAGSLSSETTELLRED